MRACVRPLVLCCLLLLLSACASLRPEPPQVSLVGLRVQELTLSHVNLLAELRLFNPNRMGLTVEEVEYALTLNNISISAGKSLVPVRVEAGESAVVVLRLSGAYFTLFQLVGSLQQGEELRYLLDGSAKISGAGLAVWTFPLRQEGSISAETLRGVTGGR